MFSFFRITQQTIDRSAKEMNERIIKGLQEKDSNYENVYKQEMQRLSTLQSDIVSPPCYVFKKEDYRNQRIPLLKRLTKESEKYFVKNIDNQMQEAEAFVQKMENVEDPNSHDGRINSRSAFLTQAAAAKRTQGTQGLRNFLRGNTVNQVGTDVNPSIFQKFHTMDQFINEEKGKRDLGNNEDKKGDKKKNENDFLDQVHWKIQSVFFGFDSESLLNKPQKKDTEKKNSEKKEKMEKFDELDEFKNISGIITKLNILNSYGTSDKKPRIRNMVTALQLTTVENSPLSGILWDNEVPGGTGLDFMVEKYPDILEDILRHKVLVKLDRAIVKIVEKQGIDVLNWKEYADLNVKEKSLSRAVSELGLVKDRLTQEYMEFKTPKLEAMRLNEEEKKNFASNIDDNLTYLFRKTRENRVDVGRFEWIGNRLRKYTKFLNTFNGCDPIGKVGDILQYRDGYYVHLEDSENLKDLKDFSYLINSSAKDIIRKYDKSLKAESISGIEYLIKKDPKLMDQLMAYVLLSQLESEVKGYKEQKHYGDGQQIPGLDQEKYQNLMNIKNNININDAKISLQKLRTEYDNELMKLADQTPELYANYPQWNYLVSAKIHKEYGGISEEDFRILDTNDLDKIEELKGKYKNDLFLKKTLDYRTEVIRKIENLEGNRPGQKDKKKSKVQDYGNDEFYLDEINHERQKTLQGCWSVVLSEMLKYESIDLKQDEIRSYRAIPSYEEEKHKYRESYDQNTGASSNLASRMNLIARVLPNTALHRVQLYCSEPIKVATLRKKIETVVKGQSKALGIAYAGHYRLIIGLERGLAKVYDPLWEQCRLLDLNAMAARTGKSTVEMFWFENIKTELNDKDEPAFEVQRTIGENNNIQSRIKYDKNGDLQQQLFDVEKQEWLSFDDYIDKNKPTGINKDTKDYIDPEYVHENYEAFNGKPDNKSEGHMIYLPKKLKLKNNNHEEEKN